MEPTPQEMAAQLRQPHGDFGLEVGDMMNKSNEHINKLVYDCLELQKGDDLLEIGFGNGFFISYVLEKHPGIFYSGIDYSLDMVKEATYRNKRYINTGEISIKEASIADIPYPENFFTAVCTINTLYFWPDPLANAQEIFRVLKPGGKLYLGIRPKHSVKDFPFIDFGFTLYDVEEAEELLKDAGFKKISYIQREDPPVEWNGKEVVMESVCLMGEK